MSINENMYIINLDSGIDKASPEISQFTHNAGCIKFVVKRNFSDFAVVLISSIENSVYLTTEGERFIKTFNEESGETEIIWYPTSEITALSGCVTYQIAAYNVVNNDEIWYSTEGRLIVSDSIDSTGYSAHLLGSEPNLLTKLLTLVKSLELSAQTLKDDKVDKAEGMGLSQNSFTNEHMEALGRIISDMERLLDSAPESLNTLSKIASALGNNADFSKDVLSDVKTAVDNSVSASNSILNHVSASNPHGINKNTIGLGNVDNTSDEEKPLSNAATEALGTKLDKSAISHTMLDVPESKWKELIPSLFLLAEYVEIGRFVHSIDKLDILNGYDTFPSVEVLVDYVASQLYPPPDTVLSGTLYSNTEYQLGVVNDLTLTFPADPNPGDVVYINFMSPTTPTNLTIDMTNVFDVEIIPEPDTGYEIFGKYTSDGWIVNYSEFSVDMWDYEEPDIMM